MASVPSMEACPFLTTLPVELRRQIYTYLVSFSTPLKLRQIIPGSRDLAILRTNRQVHDEALSVLYELNTIVVTRNGQPFPIPSRQTATARTDNLSRLLPPHRPHPQNPAPPGPGAPLAPRGLQHQHRVHDPRAAGTVSGLPALRVRALGGSACDAQVEGCECGFPTAYRGVCVVETGV